MRNLAPLSGTTTGFTSSGLSFYNRWAIIPTSKVGEVTGKLLHGCAIQSPAGKQHDPTAYFYSAAVALDSAKGEIDRHIAEGSKDPSGDRFE